MTMKKVAGFHSLDPGFFGPEEIAFEWRRNLGTKEVHNDE